MWFLSSDGQSQGPHASEQIADMIFNRGMRTGFVCSVGQQQWIPLEHHPVFGPMLAGSYVPPSSNAAPSMAANAIVRPAGLTTSGRGPWWPWSLLGLPFALAIMAAIIMVAVGNTGTMAHWIPKDVTAYAEISEVSEMLDAMTQMRVFDHENRDRERTMGDLAEGLGRGLEIDDEIAREVVEDLESVAVASRKDGLRTDGAVLLRLSSAGAMEELLETSAFERVRALGSSGALYRMRRGELDLEALAIWYGSSPNATRVKRTEPPTIAWFHDHRLLVLGAPSFLDDMVDVLDGDASSLADSETWQSASIDDGASSLFYVDTAVMDDAPVPRELARRYLDGVGALVWETHVEEQGTLTTLRGDLRGPGIPTAELPEPPELELHRRLPASTVAYLTLMIPKGVVDAEDVQHAVLANVKPVGMQSLFADVVRQVVSTLWAASGGELTVAVSMSSELRLDEHRTFAEQLEHLAACVVLEIDDREVLDEQLKMMALMDLGSALRVVFPPHTYDVVVTNDGISIDAKRPGVPSLRVELMDDALVIAVGGRAMVEESMAAARGRAERIDEVPAHDRAVAAVAENARARVWLDVGRLALALPTEARNASLSPHALVSALGLPPRGWVLEGDDRLTFAAGLQLEADGATWHGELRMLNGDALLGTLAARITGSVVQRIAQSQALGRAQSSNPRWPGATPPARAPRGTPSFW